jgi:septin 4
LLQVLKEIEKHSIDIYQYPECDSDEDEEFKQQDKQLKVYK